MPILPCEENAFLAVQTHRHTHHHKHSHTHTHTHTHTIKTGVFWVSIHLKVCVFVCVSVSALGQARAGWACK